jgi:hypothetical protein
MGPARSVGLPDSSLGTGRPPFAMSDTALPQAQSPIHRPADAVAPHGPQPYVPTTASDAVPIPGAQAEENGVATGEAPTAPSWPGRRTALGVLGCAALITAGVALWPGRDRPPGPERPWHPVASEPPTPGAGTREIRIRPANFDQRSWFSKYGPVYEDDPSIVRQDVLNAHVYGQVTGRFVYTFNFDGPSTGEARLRAYLSADAVQYRSTPGTFSDVEVLVNGHRVDMLRVVSDQGHGESCTVPFDGGLLRRGGNTLVFRVREDAKYAHGLCIYGESLASGTSDKWIDIVV